MTAPADELRAAAQTLLDLADETAEEIEANDYWHSQIVNRPRWYANGVENALGGPAGKLAGLFSPEATREIAAWLRVAAEYVSAGPAHPTHLVRALAVARALNGGQR
jgi:hypothetical protein